MFGDHPTTVFGQKLKDQVEERLSFFESGELPRKNIEVMQEAISELQTEKMQLTAATCTRCGKSPSHDCQSCPARDAICHGAPSVGTFLM